MDVKIKRLTQSAIIPKYQTQGSSGLDLHVTVDTEIKPGTTELLSTGLSMEIPMGYEGQIRPRSSMSKHGMLVANSPGTIDSDYRGEVKVLMLNTGAFTRLLKAGSRVAQLVVAPVTHVRWEETENELTRTERGTGGFGSTGS